MKIDRHLLAASWHHWWSHEAPEAGPGWLKLVWTGLVSVLLAGVFTVVGHALLVRPSPSNAATWLAWFARNLVITSFIGYLTHALFAAGDALLGRQRLRALRGWRKTAFFIGLPIAGVIVGWPAGVWLALGGTGWWQRLDSNLVLASVALSTFITLILLALFAAHSRGMAARMHATDAQLKLLQAQVEPHFLFNTLANVLSLMDADPPRARGMLEAFVDYLRNSLHQQRGDATTVGAELALAQAYLELLAARMDDRLRFEIQASDAAREARIPPLLLQPLVENAIRHGLEPKVEGGTVSIEACLRGDRLQIGVTDDGQGLDAPRRAGIRGNGVALSNIRERLAARYGGRATLRLERLQPGTRALLDIPLE
jgi:hypothetical protein